MFYSGCSIPHVNSLEKEKGKSRDELGDVNKFEIVRIDLSSHFLRFFFSKGNCVIILLLFVTIFHLSDISFVGGDGFLQVSVSQ